MKNVNLLLVLMLAITIAFTGCGEKGAEKGGEVQESIKGTEAQKAILKSKTVQLMSGDYYMKYSIDMEGMTSEAEVSKKGEKIATSATSEGESARSIMDGNTQYTIMDSQKMIMKTIYTESEGTNDANGMKNMEDTFNVDENDVFTTGEETIDGTKYFYEDFSGTKFYFVGDELKMIKAEDETIKVLACEKKSKNSMFDIPKNYKVIENNLNASGVPDSSSINDMAAAYVAEIPAEYSSYMNGIDYSQYMNY